MKRVWTTVEMILAMIAMAAVVILASQGCAPVIVDKTPEADTGVAWERLSSTVDRFVDRDARVVCWRYAFGHKAGLSCLPLEQTSLGG